MSPAEATNPRDLSPRSEMMKKSHVLILAMLVLVYSLSAVEISPAASSPGAKSSLFPEIKGWKQTGGILTFSPRKLYDYIDGAADLYLTYEFQELEVAEYQNEKKASVTVEVYRHKTPTQAFGIYSQERLSNANFLDIGAQGFVEKNILIFTQANYYVKINSSETGAEDEEVLLAFAKAVAKNLGEKGFLPAILSAFPEEGKRKNSEKFIAKNFLGYSFFLSGFTADYDLSGKKFKLYVMEGANPEECKNMIQKYLEKIQKARENVGEGRYTILDPYHGEMDFAWKGKYIWGVWNLDDPVLRSKYLKLFEEALQK
jgi:hypothetical protein